MVEFFKTPDYETTAANFLSELTKASRSQPAGLSYIKNEIPKTVVMTDGLVQGFVFGGTNFETALFQLRDKKASYIPNSLKTGILPTFADKETFLTFFNSYFDRSVEAVGVNFAHPLLPGRGKFGELDGSLLYGTKEHAFHELLHLPLGDTLRNFTGKDIPISVANDTTCLTFDGDALVAGSGLNIGINVLEEEKYFSVNLEAGNFAGFEATEELETIDENSPTQGKNRFEKMLSGIYLPQHYNLITRSKKINAPVVDDGSDVSALAASDQGVAGDLARALLVRSASLTAAAVAGVYEFKKRPKQLRFTAEGSLFWKGWHFEKNLDKRFKLLGIPDGSIVFKQVRNSAMIGAIKLLTRTG